MIRELRRWTMHDMLSTLCDGSEKSARHTLGSYLRAIESIGVIKREKRGLAVPGACKPLSLWVLVRDIGRRPPVLRADRGEIYNPNSGETLRLPLACTFTGPERDENSKERQG